MEETADELAKLLTETSEKDKGILRLLLNDSSQAYPDILLLVLGFLHKNRQMLVRTIKMSWHTFCDYSSVLNRSHVWLQFGTLTPI